MGVERIEWIQLDFGSLISKLRAGRIDQIACGLFIRPERELLVAFSSPSVCIGPGLLVQRDNPFRLHSFSDVADQEGIRLAVIAGAVEMQDALRAGIPRNRIVSYPNLDVALSGLRNGQVEALTLSAPTIQQLAEHNSDLQRAMPFAPHAGAVSCGAFAFRLTDKKLRDHFDRALRDFIGSEEHIRLLQPFAMNKENLPGRMQTRNQENVQ